MSETFPPSTHLRWNLRCLYWDVFWYGVLAGSGVAFLAVYAARLGASSLQIGLLSAGPAVVNLIFTLPAGRWLEGHHLVRASFLSSVWQRLGYLVIVTLPWFLHEQPRVWGLVWITLAMSVPMTLLSISFNAMFAEVVPADWRARVVGWRNALVAVSVTLTTLLSGFILDQVASPYNYQIVFLIGGIGGLMSSYYLGRIRLEDAPAPVRQARLPLRRWCERLSSLWAQIARPRAQSKSLLRLDLLRGPFGLFMLSYLAFYTCQYLGLPIFPLFNVNELGLTDGMISVGGALFHGTMMLASLWLNRVTLRLGNRKMLIASATLFGLYPLILGLAQDAWLYYVASVVGGVVFAFLNGAMINRLMERVPADDRPAHMTLHNLALNLGILAGSLLGPVFGDWLGLRNALFISGALRALVGLLFFFAG